MENREKVVELVRDGSTVYADCRAKQEELLRHRDLYWQAERDLLTLQQRRDAIDKQLKALGYHDVGHAKGELWKTFEGEKHGQS